MHLIGRSRQSSTAGYMFLRDFLQDIIAYKTEHIQESPLTIIHFQHDKRYSLALEKSNFLQQMLQQQSPTIPAVSLSSRVSFYLPLQSHSKSSSSANNPTDSYASLLFFSKALFCCKIDSTFSISSTDLITSICIWKVLFTSGMLSWLRSALLERIFFRLLFVAESLSPLFYLW